jgi:hypothetical protein
MGSKDPAEADIAIGALEQRIKPLAEGSCRVCASSTGGFISQDHPSGQPKRLMQTGLFIVHTTFILLIFPTASL